MAVTFSELSNGNIVITETGKPALYIMGHVYCVMTTNDAGTVINLRDGDFNRYFLPGDITHIGNTAGPFTTATALTALSLLFKK